MHLFFTGLFRPVFYCFHILILVLGAHTIWARQASTLPVIDLQINQITLHAEVVDTDLTRAQGLMHRQFLAPNSGMLFIFDEVHSPCFWMKNTPLPLSIAFITEKGLISNIEDMTPFNLASTCPITPIKFALEMEQGWFSTHQIQAGDYVKHLPQ